MRLIGSALRRVALERPHGVVGELELVPAADEQPEGALAAAFVGGRRGQAPPQERERRLELVLARLGRHFRADPLRPHARVLEAAADALAAPAVERAAVIREALRAARVVEVALLAEHA